MMLSVDRDAERIIRFEIRANRIGDCQQQHGRGIAVDAAIRLSSLKRETRNRDVLGQTPNQKIALEMERIKNQEQ
jgi:hypothetical protein